MRWVTTTASSTPCLKTQRVNPLAPSLAWFGALLLACVLVLVPALARAQSVNADVTQMRLESDDEGVFLNANVQFTLAPIVQDVLDKGIAIYFVAEAEVYRERWYWTDQLVAEAARYMRLSYQPLTRRWRLNVSATPVTNAGLGVTLNQNFDTLEEALDAVKRIGRLRLGEVRGIGDDSAHPVVFRFRLDTSQLPRPFQIGVVGHSDWNISAERNARLTVEKTR
mgnify:CR=1 FL=1